MTRQHVRARGRKGEIETMTVTRFATIDEHLGEGCGRFFGDGFK